MKLFLSQISLGLMDQNRDSYNDSQYPAEVSGCVHPVYYGTIFSMSVLRDKRHA